MKTLLHTIICLLFLSNYSTIYGQTDDGVVRIPRLKLVLKKDKDIFLANQGYKSKALDNMYSTYKGDKIDFASLAFLTLHRTGVAPQDWNRRTPAERGQLFVFENHKLNSGRGLDQSLVVDFFSEDDLESVYSTDKTNKLLEKYLQKAEKKIEDKYKETLDFIDKTLSKYDLDRAVAERLSNDLRQQMKTEINQAIDREREKSKQDLLNDSVFLAELKKKLAAGN